MHIDRWMDGNFQGILLRYHLAKSLLAAAGYDTGVATPATDILGQYGLYIAAIVVVVIVIVAAVVVMRMRKKPAT
jgi:uncharacterized membrane protein